MKNMLYHILSIFGSILYALMVPISVCAIASVLGGFCVAVAGLLSLDMMQVAVSMLCLVAGMTVLHFTSKVLPEDSFKNLR